MLTSWVRRSRRWSGGRHIAALRTEAATARSQVHRARAPLTLIAATGATALAGASLTAQLDMEPLITWLGACVFGAVVALLTWRPWAAWAIALATASAFAAVEPVADVDPWPWPVIAGTTLIATVVAVAITSRVMITIPVTTVTSALFAALSAENTQVGWGVGIILFAIGGLLIRWRAHVRVELARSEETSEVERARRAVLEERTRIARELHDVVAHRMSLVVVAAETAPYRLGGVTPPVQQELQAISATAREAMSEMRALLGVLRQPDETAAHTPQQGLADLDELVAGAIRAGLPVRLGTRGDLEDVGPVVQQSAYRIIQESLANAARHAPGAGVTVSVEHARPELKIVISNEPPATVSHTATNGHPNGPPRHGLTGMAERAAAVGGTVRAGPRWDGGFEVAAVLPTVDERVR